MENNKKTHGIWVLGYGSENNKKNHEEKEIKLVRLVISDVFKMMIGSGFGAHCDIKSSAIRLDWWYFSIACSQQTKSETKNPKQRKKI